MSVQGINHLNIRTPNFKQSVEFMTEVLGMGLAVVPGVDTVDKAAWILDANGTAVIHMASASVAYSANETLPDPPPRGSGAVHHIALTCTDYAGMKARLAAHGIEFRENPPRGGVQQIFVQDPSDITFELNFSAI